ncbi:MAG: MMPL family transporter [Gammaproteobacteria bacterium]|nr:MMPL family transporter [Gammaproteobacteria bacterium]
MKELEESLGPWVLKYRWLIIVLTLFLVFGAASGGRFLVFKADYRVFFSADNPQLQAFDNLEKTYSHNDNVLFVLSPKDGNVFTRETLKVIETLTEKSWQIPYSTRVDSISNFQHTYAEGDDLIVEDLVSDAGNLSNADLEKIKNIAINEPLLKQRLVSPKGHVTSVSALITLPNIDQTKEVPEVMNHARNLAEEIRVLAPNIDVRVSGMVPMNNAFAESAQGDMQTLVPISFAVMFIMLLFLLKSFSTTFGTILVIFLSIMTGMGLGGYIGFPLTGPSVSSMTIILTVAIANSVHVLTTLLHGMRMGKEKNNAIIETLRINLQPVFLASATTMIGFLTMNFSDVPPFQHLGNFVAMGVVASFILSVTFLPALVSVLPVRVKVQEEESEPAMVKLGDFVVSKQKPLMYGMGALILVLVMFVSKNELNDVFVHYFDETIEFRQDSDYIDKNLTGLYIIDYSLVSSEPGGISAPEYLNEVESFANWYRQQPETRHVNIYTEVIKRLNKNMHGDDKSWMKIPEERNLAAQYLLMYEMSLPYGLDLNNQINIDKSALRMTVSIKTMSSNEILSLEKRAAKWITDNAKHIKEANGSGPTVMFANIGQRNINSMLIGTTLAMVLISAILIIAFRSVKTGLVSMVPNLVPAAMGFGLWGIFVGEVGLGLSVVTTMTLGIVVDDTVHFLSKYLRAKREYGYTAENAVRYAFTHVGRALLTTSIVLVAGFMVLAQSHFALNSGMGLLTAIIITFALLADFFFLPPLLMKLEKK